MTGRAEASCVCSAYGSVRGFASYLNIAVQEARSARGRNSVRAGRAERERIALERGGQAVPAREPGDVGTRGAGGSGGLSPEREVRNAERKLFEAALPDLWEPVNGSGRAGAESRERQPGQREGVRRAHSPQPLGLRIRVPSAARLALAPEGASRLFPLRVAFVWGP